MTPTSAQWQLLDAKLDGTAAEKLTEFRAAGKSYDEIAFDVYALTGMRLSGESFRRWADQLGIGAAA